MVPVQDDGNENGVSWCDSGYDSKVERTLEEYIVFRNIKYFFKRVWNDCLIKKKRKGCNIRKQQTNLD